MACGGKSEGVCNDGFCGGAHEHEPSLSVSGCVDVKDRRGLCSKCKDKKAQVKANQTERLCGECLHASLLGKFKGVFNAHATILPTDNILLAFSGGPASRVALEFIQEIQSKAQRDSDASKDNVLRVFRFGVAFVDESAALNIDSDEECQVIEEVKSIVSDKLRQQVDLHIIPIEHIWSSDNASSKEKLSYLLESICDTTGKEDLLGYLRMQVLQKVAIEHGYNKLILGLCTTRLAAHVVASTVKGRGYILPGDVQYVDARWKVPVVLPLRDCVAKELTMLCHIHSWKTVFSKALSTLSGSYFSLNNLVASFVALLQEENPSRERTIVRTAEKLKAFGFNRIPETEAIQHLPRRRRDALQNCTTVINAFSEVLCPICSGPLNEKNFEEIRKNLGTDADLPTLQVAVKNGETNLNLPSSIFHCLCCPSCQFQILQEQSPSSQYIYSLLPDVMKKKATENVVANESWMRRQIGDYLLFDDGGDEVHDAA